MTWYVVFKGRRPGVYPSWPTCNREVYGYPGNLYQGYMEKAEAYEAYDKYLAYEKRGRNVTEAVAYAKGSEDEAPVAARISIKDYIIVTLIVVVVIQLVIIAKM